MEPRGADYALSSLRQRTVLAIIERVFAQGRHARGGLEPMQIVLIDEVENLGIAGDIREVKDGFARNYLIPQNLAVKASKEELARADSRKKVEVERRTRLNTEVEGVVEQLEGKPVVIEVRVGPAGRLYGSVTATDIAEVVSEQIGKELDRHAVTLSQPIREVSDHTVRVRLAPDVFATLNVSVQPEGGSPPTEDATDDETAPEPTVDQAIAAEEKRLEEEAAAAEEDSEQEDEAIDGETPAAELDEAATEASVAEDDASADEASSTTDDASSDEAADPAATEDEDATQDDVSADEKRGESSED